MVSPATRTCHEPVAIGPPSAYRSEMASFGSRLIGLLPHYLAMIAMVFGVLLVIQELYGGLGFWASFAIALAVAAIYPTLVRRLGVAPDAWDR